MGAAGGIAIAGANMWALLLDKDPGHSAAASDLALDVVDRKLKKAAAAVVKVEEAPPARNVAMPAKRGDKAKKKKKSAANVYYGNSRINGAVESQQAAAPAAVPDGDELADGREEIEEILAALRSIEEAEKKEAKEEVFNVVTARGGRRRTVAARTSKAAVVAEDVTVVTGTNMWALLSDEDPGDGSTTEGGSKQVAATAGDGEVWSNDQKEAAAVIPIEVAKPAKPGKKTKTKKKNHATGDSKRAAAMVNGEETPAKELEEEMSEEEEEMSDDVDIGASRCWTVASRACRAAVVVAMLAVYFKIAS